MIRIQFFLFLLIFPAFLIGQEKSSFVWKNISVNDPAPPIVADSWVKKPSRKITPFTLVEFSATWCAPCRKAIPVLSDLATIYGDKMNIISIYAHENTGTDSFGYVRKVAYFISSIDSIVKFSVAAVHPKKQYGNAWGLSGIPTMFLLDSMRVIRWIGSDINDLKAQLPRLVKRTVSHQAQNPGTDIRSFIDTIISHKQNGKIELAIKEADSLLDLYPNKDYLYRLKFRILAGADDCAANLFLYKLLLTDPVQFDWEHLVPETWGLPSNPDPDIVIRIADKAIETAETDLVKARGHIQKADAFCKFGKYSAAVEQAEIALSLARKTKMSDEIRNYQESLAYYQDILRGL